MPPRNRFFALIAAAMLATAAAEGESPAYRASDRPGDAKVDVVRETWTDAARQRREVPVLLYLPKGSNKPAPVVVFSHGLGGSREGYAYLGEFWASHGYVSVHIQHPGSDDAVWRDAPQGEGIKALAAAARSPTVALQRAQDMPFLLDELAKRHADEASPLAGRLDMERVAIAGHSFGAWSALVAGGQRIVSPSGRAMQFADPRVKAILPLSAPDDVRVPAMHMTATLDDSPIGGTSPEERRIPFDSAPAPAGDGADSYLVIFDGGDHMTFAGTPTRRLDKTQRDNDQTFHPMIRLATLAFLDAYLRGDESAKRWLQEGGLAKSLGKQATLEMKRE